MACVRASAQLSLVCAELQVRGLALVLRPGERQVQKRRRMCATDQIRAV
jgi:hypothetical protein